MSSRRRARGFALQVLCAADVRGLDVGPTLDGLVGGMSEGKAPPQEGSPTPEETQFARRLVEGVQGARESIDGLIEKSSTNWRVTRMPLVDRNILRLAIYELMHCEDIPGAVSINEAVELAKRFGGSDSRAFVNGIVDRVGRELGRVRKA
jgi:N utilization substance protein B